RDRKRPTWPGHYCGVNLHQRLVETVRNCGAPWRGPRATATRCVEQQPGPYRSRHPDSTNVRTSPPEQGKWFTSARLTDRARAQLIRPEAVLSAQIGGYLKPSLSTPRLTRTSAA